MSADSPVIHSIDPHSVSTTDEDVTVTVRGSGFSPRSVVGTADRANVFVPQTFVSPAEIHLSLRGVDFYEGPESIWIADDDFKRIGEPEID